MMFLPTCSPPQRHGLLPSGHHHRHPLPHLSQWWWGRERARGFNYSTLPGNIMSKVIIQQPSGLHMSMGMGDLGEQCLDSTADMRRTVYLCTDDTPRQSEQELSAHDLKWPPQPGQMETDYIVLPRSSAALVSGAGSSSVPTLLKEDSKNEHDHGLSVARQVDALQDGPQSLTLGPRGWSTWELEQQYPVQAEHMQNLPFEPRTAVKNFLAEMEESGGLSRSETGFNCIDELFRGVTLSLDSLDISKLYTSTWTQMLLVSQTWFYSMRTEMCREI